MKNSLNFLKTVRCDEIKESNLVYVTIHHHVIQWLFPFTLTAILSNRRIYLAEWNLNRPHIEDLKNMYFSAVSISK